MFCEADSRCKVARLCYNPPQCTYTSTVCQTIAPNCSLRQQAQCGGADCIWSSQTRQCYSTWLQFSDLYQGCQLNGSSLDCTALPVVEWDGILADGTSVFAAGRISGAAFRPLKSTVSCSATQTAGVPPVLPLAHLACDMRVEVLPSAAINATLYLPQLQSLFGDLADNLVQFLTACRLQSAHSSTGYTDDELSMLYRYVLSFSDAG